jgi:hypothetical protein
LSANGSHVVQLLLIVCNSELFCAIMRLTGSFWGQRARDFAILCALGQFLKRFVDSWAPRAHIFIQKAFGFRTIELQNVCFARSFLRCER